MLVLWYSKRQSTFEASLFGAEFVVIKQGIDVLRELRYKLRRMCIPIKYFWGQYVSDT